MTKSTLTPYTKTYSLNAIAPPMIVDTTNHCNILAYLTEGGPRINRDPGLAIFGALGFGICQINYLGSGIGTFAGTRDWGFEKIGIRDLRV